VVRGAESVAAQAILFAGPDRVTRRALVNGAAGVVITIDGQPIAVMGFTVVHAKIVTIDSLGDPDRLGRLDLSTLDE
jgi:RNA polymerase sigma-70 factor (ECF subfamily)